jgi:hypothetical protein
MGGIRGRTTIGPVTREGAYRAAALCGMVVLLAAFTPAGPGNGRAAAATIRPSAVASVPGMPGTPQPPTSLFAEDFENRPGTLPIRLNTYTGASGMTYTADPPWLKNCNGWVAAFNDPAGNNSLVAAQVASPLAVAVILGEVPVTG